MAMMGFVFRAVVFYEELSFWFNFWASVGSFFLLVLIWSFFDYLNKSLNKSLPYENNIVKRISIQLSIGLFFAYIFINSLFYVNIYFYKFAEINKVVIVAGNLIWTLVVLAINGFFIGEYFFNKWKQALTRNLEIEKNLAQVQFLNLQNQLNPHFLFNSLTVLNSLMQEDTQRASTFLKQLATMYRYVMQHNQDALVSLSDELSFLQHYLALLSTRFGNAFQYKIEIGEEYANRKIVPVTLQILIENAVKHNQMSEEKPLLVEVYVDMNYLCVKNPKNLKKSLTTSNKIGLENLQKLYKTVKPHASLFIEDLPTHFMVKIPL
jgi:sensor histidine kinase YesM